MQLVCIKKNLTSVVSDILKKIERLRTIPNNTQPSSKVFLQHLFNAFICHNNVMFMNIFIWNCFNQVKSIIVI